MSSAVNLSYNAANAAADAIGAMANGGSLLLYDGTQPVSPETGVSGNNLLATFQLANPAFGAAINGALTVNAVASVTVNLTSTVTWFRVLEADGLSVVFDGSVGTSNAALIMNQVSLQSGGVISLTGTFIIPGV